ncbi:hypothetical protein [Streptomyces lonarensis]|uniref:Uncharacterized protein n=1 Tax=Streptomyces lonarensis TaxID=700599 RepID=A0A7X6D2G5_9ACTN|nr:hypothetical protein [Streptomyces lonarensis]NJQ06952.1 hypothetical protein [Streptomyces lonarensis]
MREESAAAEGVPSAGLLPYGATGFLRRGAGPLPEVPAAEFRAALHHAARVARGRITAMNERSYPLTYHHALISDRQGDHTVLGHCHLRWIAFVDDVAEIHREEFVTPPDWAVAFTHAGFAVLGRETLRLGLDQAGWDALTPFERREARFHETRTLGGAVFNRWD